MLTRYFVTQDLPTLNAWWKRHAGPDYAFDPRMLPSGLVVEGANRVPLAIGFLYRTDSSIAWLEWISGNPDVSAEERANALNILIDGLLAEAKGLGFTVLFSSTNLPSLSARLEAKGFPAVDKGVTLHIRRI